MQADLETAFQVFAVLILVGFVGWCLYAYFTRARSLVRKWAHENGYELLHTEYRVFRKGPYVWSSRSQAVYRVEALDDQGNQRKGWVRCGSFWLGVFTDKVEAKWDD